MSETMNGKWHYRSFRHDPIIVKGGYVEGNPELAIPWSPPGVLEASTDAAGEVTGKLTFTPEVVLDIKGHITPASGNTPASVQLTGEFHGSITKVKGFFIPGSDHIVGTILSMENDMAKQPVGTAGPFVLFPVKSQGNE